LGLRLPGGITIVDPQAVAERYVAPLAALRRHKGWTEEVAREHLADPVTLGTMMLKLGEVDGLVSGAVHTTAATVRPALQILGPKPGSRLVSSVFFMCLPDQVVIYGDCAINPQPGAEDLADIAIQSAASARDFGIEPKVAMISFSTGTSGIGTDVDKVAEAVRIVRQREPGLAVDGPMQYDAAAIASVGQAKRPGSPVAGQASVFIFPDLDTGNTTYKAVQRSAQVVSIGPMLQGLAKPVNDLSRGALVDDIIYTVALTAIQARGQVPLVGASELEHSECSVAQPAPDAVTVRRAVPRERDAGPPGNGPAVVNRIGPTAGCPPAPPGRRAGRCNPTRCRTSRTP